MEDICIYCCNVACKCDDDLRESKIGICKMLEEYDVDFSNCYVPKE